MSTNKVDIIVSGFAVEADLHDGGSARYRPNIVLVRAARAVIVIDPGTVDKQNDIVDALAKHHVRVTDVTHLIHTHHHLDHHRNAGLFPDIPVIDGWATWSGVTFQTGAPTLPEGVLIERTPGHTYDSLTVFVDTLDGLVAICGDVMWWEGDTQSDVYAESIDQLKKSRQDVLSRADIVIPGHGPAFSVKK